ncbi:MAG: chloride channel protein [Hyphomicrobiales bacterium]|nr:chloride channel protein [Hyphomicrobiales bacterium]
MTTERLVPLGAAIGLGLLSGFVTALVLFFMTLFEHALWPEQSGPLRIFLTVMTGGALIAWLRRHEPDATMESTLDQVYANARAALQPAATLAALGIVSVGFGGAIGPEAGVLAVIGELSALVSGYIGRDLQQRRLIGRIGNAGALGALYGSPPGGASYGEGSAPDAPWPLLVLAALAGLGGFLLANHALPKGAGLAIPMPPVGRDGEASALALAVAPALLGAVLGLIHLMMRSGATKMLALLSNDVRLRVLAASLIFALLAAFFPIVRFNGQHQLSAAMVDPALAAPAVLMGVSVLKALALALCLAGGWLGGPIMPLSFVGAAGGLALAAYAPGLDPGIAVAASVAATATVVMKRPLTVLLVLIFLGTNHAVLALTIGVAIGAAALRLTGLEGERDGRHH